MVPDVPVLRGERPGHRAEELPAAHVERGTVEPGGQVQQTGPPMSRRAGGEGMRTSKSAVLFFFLTHKTLHSQCSAVCSPPPVQMGNTVTHLVFFFCI